MTNAPSPVAHLSPDEHAARGKSARTEVPRRSHAEWAPSTLRPDPVDLLEQQAETRVPELVPIRYGRMLVSPFTFFRGAALIMASDLAATPRSGIRAQLCGDAHLSNFGVFGTPERKLLFDINDFDETHPGPWEWDVKRLAASFAVAGRERGFSERERAAIIASLMLEYRNAMRSFASMHNLDVWYAHLDIDRLVAEQRDAVSSKIVAGTEAALAKARTRDSMRAFEKLTHVVDGAAAHHQRSAADRPDRGARPRHRPGRRGEGVARDVPRLPPLPGTGTALPARAVRARRISRARSSASAAWERARGSSCSSGATTAIRSSCSSRRRCRRCWSRSSAAASTTTAPSAWSRASG